MMRIFDLKRRMRMADLKKLLDYKELCGVNNKEIANSGGYPNSEQYLGQVLKGRTPLTEKEEKDIYRGINLARAKKLRGES